MSEQIQAPSVIAEPKEKNGVVYTRRWVVDLILDLVGYVPDEPLCERLLIEPSAGDGSFLLAVVERLCRSCEIRGTRLDACHGSIAAFELSAEAVAASRTAVRQALEKHGIPSTYAASLAAAWVRQADYLLETGGYVGRADYVVGNPPYIRLEDLENGGAEYRAGYPTMVGRADLYVAFYEAALRHLKPAGVCGFVCADRWMFNQYGASLRRFVTSGYGVEAVIQMHHADAFEAEVSAYPAVTVIRRAKQEPVIVSVLGAGAERIGGSALANTLAAVRETGQGVTKDGIQASLVETWFRGQEPWPLMEPGRLALLKRLERDFPTLEESGAIVGIGVATGADKIFVTKDPELVERERMLPLAMATDARGSSFQWSGHYLVDPWKSEGLVDLGRHPRLAAYLESHRERLAGRHVGKKSPANWYRTIDRVNHRLTGKPKLYLPDFKGRIGPVLDRGITYPHHNLYFIASEQWDMEVLGGLLLSDIAQFFIEAYGVRMRGGFLRFQAQYLRRIRVPRPADLSDEDSAVLTAAFAGHDVALANAVAFRLYGLTGKEQESLCPDSVGSVLGPRLGAEII